MGTSGSDRGIVYSLVARGPVVLCDCSLVQGNSALVALSLLEKWQKNPENLASYVSDRHVFHVLTEDGLTYLCVASEVTDCVLLGGGICHCQHVNTIERVNHVVLHAMF